MRNLPRSAASGASFGAAAEQPTGFRNRASAVAARSAKDARKTRSRDSFAKKSEGRRFFKASLMPPPLERFPTPEFAQRPARALRSIRPDSRRSRRRVDVPDTAFGSWPHHE